MYRYYVIFSHRVPRNTVSHSEPTVFTSISARPHLARLDLAALCGAQCRDERGGFARAQPRDVLQRRRLPRMRQRGVEVNASL